MLSRLARLLAGLLATPLVEGARLQIEASQATRQVDIPRPCGAHFYTCEDIVLESPEWCGARRVPKKLRVPHKLRGLFWMRNNMYVPDVLVCMSLGVWDAEHRTVYLHTYESFVWIGKVPGALSALQTPGKYFTMTFADDNLDKAVVKPYSFQPRALLFSWFLDTASSMPLEEVPCNSGGKWKRATRLVNGIESTYTFVRIMDVDKNKSTTSHYDIFQDVYAAKDLDWWKSFGQEGKGLSVFRCPRVELPDIFAKTMKNNLGSSELLKEGRGSGEVREKGGSEKALTEASPLEAKAEEAADSEPQIKDHISNEEGLTE